MAKIIVKFQRYFRRKPIRFFTFIVLYLTAGSVVFLHAGFEGEHIVSYNDRILVGGTSGAAELPDTGPAQLSRVFKEAPESPSTARRYGPWFKTTAKELPERSKAGDFGGAWNRALKRRSMREQEEGRDGSAIFRGCFHRPDNISLALPVSSVMMNMSVDKCVDFCSEKIDFCAVCSREGTLLNTFLTDCPTPLECPSTQYPTSTLSIHL
ncbi:hypothetical protein FKM82_004983 [Ascaphus truei]